MFQTILQICPISNIGSEISNQKRNFLGKIVPWDDDFNPPEVAWRKVHNISRCINEGEEKHIPFQNKAANQQNHTTFYETWEECGKGIKRRLIGGQFNAIGEKEKATKKHEKDARE